MIEPASDDRQAPQGTSTPDIVGHVGVIDIGSNAIRLQVTRLFANGTYKVVADDRDPVRLGSEVFRSGQISEVAWDQALKTIERLDRQARQRGVDSIRAVATSAMREANNGQAFADEILRRTGISVEIISGDREAALIAKGVLAGLKYPPSPLVLVDIGGGSTELSVVASRVVKFGVSLPLGSARLTEQFCHSDPLSSEDEAALRGFIRSQLIQAIPNDFKRVRHLVGSAGTFGAVGNFIRRKVSPATGQSSRTKDGGQSSTTKFSSWELSRACNCLRTMTLAERRSTKGFEERRAEIIVAGAILLQEISMFFGVEKLRGARRGLRDGLMLEELEKRGIEVQ